MKKYKIVYIGAGSFRFTIPCAMNILDFAKSYHPVELWFVDINPIALRLMGEGIRQMIRMHKKDIILHLTTDRRKALPDADLVLISISIGKQEAEWFDIHIPLKFGIPQNTGDTVGPGGILRGVRTIPTMIDFIKDINELCPQATVLNYTNPQGFLMLATIQAAPNIQAFGLCHELFYVNSKPFGRFLKLCGVDKAKNGKFTFKYGGLNHFSWVTEITYDGQDIYPKIRENADFAYTSKKYHRPYNYYLLKKYGYFCYVGDRHIAEFIPQYYNYFNYKEGPFGIVKLRNVSNIAKQRRLVYGLVKMATKNPIRWLFKLFLRPMEGGEKALLMIKDKLNNRPKHHVCNVLNKGTIPNLPDNCVVEVPCFFNDNKLQPTKIESLPSKINELVLPHAKNQQLVVNAALSGNLDDLLKALLADPMCQFIEDDDKIEAMMKNLLFYQKKWLPKFSESIPSSNELKKSKYYLRQNEFLSVKLATAENFLPDPNLKAKAWPQLE
jgi:alpha-galactosidase